MRIHNEGINKILNIYKNQTKTNKTKGLERGKKADQLNISNTARDFQIAMESVKKQPEVRAEKVEEIKKQVEAGTYKIDAKAIAEKMMKDANIYTKL